MGSTRPGLDGGDAEREQTLNQWLIGWGFDSGHGRQARRDRSSPAGAGIRRVIAELGLKTQRDVAEETAE